MTTSALCWSGTYTTLSGHGSGTWATLAPVPTRHLADAARAPERSAGIRRSVLLASFTVSKRTPKPQWASLSILPSRIWPTHTAC
jgi:hypothetical protein